MTRDRLMAELLKEGETKVESNNRPKMTREQVERALKMMETQP